MRYRDPELYDRLAAQYVLGTLRGPARRRFEGLLQARPDLRRQVRVWEERLPRVLGHPPAQTPPPQLWNEIERRLFADRAPVPTPWYRRLWQPLALGSGLAALVLATVLLLPFGQNPGYVAMINDQQQALWMISAVADMEQIRVRNLKPMDIPPDNRCVLWYQPRGAPAPYPVGILPDQGEERILTPPAPYRPRGPGQLLVTVEPVNGEMPEQPSSPPLYRGEWLPLEPI